MARARWTTPLYRFKLPKKKVVVNVTRSCPVFEKPTEGMDDVAALLKQAGHKRVLDFGAGKLRNTLFLLRHKARFQVWAVEFEECWQTQMGKTSLNSAKRYSGFFEKKWPAEFLTSRFEVDVVLLINVVNVVPREVDRRLIVAECTERLRKAGWFIWFSQFGEPHYKPAVSDRLRAPDGGWFYSLNKRYQTYYREFGTDEILSYFPKTRYRQVQKLNAGHNRAFIFEKL